MKKIAILLSMLLFMGNLVVNAQTKTVTGTVISAEDDMPIPGVSVSVKGTTLGTVTNIDGEFELKVPENAKDLIVSFVGMKSQTINLGSKLNFTIVLQPELVGIDEVVVTALGIKRAQRSNTSQVQNVKAEELVAVQPTRAATALAGKVAGLQINVQDNGVNPTTQILLRGLRSISASNSALIVIDNTIASQGAFDALNPNDIESMNVLKGATAAALYGSAAANGALIVTTKKGADGRKFIVGLNSSVTFEDVAYMPDFQTEYGTGWEGAYDNVENTNWGPRFDGTIRQIGPTFPDGTFQAVPYAPVANNLRDFYETGLTIQNTAYVSGSSEDSKMYLSVGQQDVQGIVPSDTYTRYTFRVNATKRIKNIEMTANISYMTDETDVVGDDIGDQDRTLYWFVLNTPANIPLTSYKDWRNDLYASPDGYYNAYYQNPYWAIDTNRDEDKSHRFTGNMGLTWDIVDWMSLTGRVGLNRVNGNGKYWRAAQTYDEDLQPSHSAVSSFVTDSEFQSNIMNANAIMNIDRDLTEDISLIANIGATTYMYHYRESELTGRNLSIPDFYDISNRTGELEGSADESQRRTYGFFGDFTFGYRDYLFLNLSGRNDWTSTLNPDNNSYFYPNIGLSFVFTDAISILKDSEAISFGKFTVSNSTVYNDLSAYAINPVYLNSSSFPFGGVNGFYLDNTSVDANIKKEKLNSTEFGLNMGFFDNIVSFDASYFITKTTDLITNTTPSRAAGATAFLTNIGELKGQGLELAVTATPIRGEFRWDINLNYTSNETEVVKITDDLDEVAISTTGTRGIYAIEGMAFPQVKASSYVRDPQGRIVVDATSGNPLVGDMKPMGKTTPDYIVGLNNTFSYKGITLTATFDYRTGHVYYAQGSDAMEFTGRSMESVSANRQDFVIPNSVIEVSPGVYEENTNVPITDGIMGYWQNTYNEIKENYVRDATALKLRELAVNYQLPASLLRNTPIETLKVGFIGRNLLTWLPSENRFSDPEFNNTNNNAIGIGGYFQSPPTRSYGFNLNVEF